MSHCLTKTDVRERTREYWEKGQKWETKTRYDCYINELLGQELQAASKDPDRLRGVGQPVHTLALTVGESFEPLLQVVCVLKPQRVVLILNRLYGKKAGQAQGKTLQDLIRDLRNLTDFPENMRPSLDNNGFELQVLKHDTPTHVFRALRDALQKPAAQPPPGFTNVVDITGAKKSMVVGAFLYAAHSGLPITYVDFDDYDEDWGKPYGYTCRIGRIANPYEAFHLRDWEQVRRLYESYSFRNARVLLGVAGSAGNVGTGIIGAMSQTLGDAGSDPLFDPDDIDKVKCLALMFEMYEAWENGDYAEAKRLKDGFNPPLPPDVVPWSIEELGGIWPHVASASDARTAAQNLLTDHLALKQGASSPSDSLFARPLPLLAYVRDELAKIERLITKNEDYRSAYLRAAGLHEFLLKARIALCWLNNFLEARPKGPTSWQPVATAFGSAEKDAFASLMEEPSESRLRRILEAGSIHEMNITGGNIRRSTTAPSLSPYFNGLPLDLAAAVHTGVGGNSIPLFVKIRGEAIHTHLYIPRPIAEAALELVRAAVEEFENNWLEHFHPGTLTAADNKPVAAPSWSRLCEVCELTFLPPRLQQ